MFEAIRNLVRGPEPEEPRPDVNHVHLAACAVLLDVAWADGDFSVPERKHIETVLERQFGLSPDDGNRLIALAEVERSKAVDHFRFTRVLQSNYDLGQKMVLAEVMWSIALADGRIEDNEQYLTRKICNLLDLEPAYLATAKAAAEKSKQ